jgi:polysaccharide biosynthesis protein PelA
LEKTLFFCWLIWLALVTPEAWATPAGEAPAVAFFYGDNPPWSELQAFDLVVVDPDHVPDPKAVGLTHTRLAAYVALGEVQASRDYAAKIPTSWLVGENKDWGSRLIDQSHPEWPRFFTDSVVMPLWDKGYRTFFLDTLDSYHLFAKTPETRAIQEAGMVAVVEAVAARYPGIKLIFNRGFEILPLTHKRVEMVVAESLFQGFDAGKGKYKVVPAEDREWLTAQLRRANDAYGLPVVVIDYVPPAERELARSTARRVKDLGFTPWVATPDLATLGVGAIEVLPRRIAVIHSVLKDEYALRQIAPVRYGAMPLQYLGYIPEYFDVRHLPEVFLSGRYAAVLLWLDAAPSESDQSALLAWLEKQRAAQIPIAMLGAPTFLMEAPFGKKLGFSFPAAQASIQPVLLAQKDAMLGYERAVSASSDNFFPLAIQLGRPLLKLSRGTDTQVAAALTPWGGYVLTSHSLVSLPGESGIRWVIDPFAFFKQALRLPDLPVPDVTTESGRRMLMVHMDGDGFISRSELQGNPMAGALVRDRIVKNYPIPMTISVIEAEISPQGLYPGLSSAAEKIAKDIFAAPHVAMASHSYSHPFIWRKASADDANEGYNLRLPGYQFDLQREIEGSIRYIEARLAPAGKKVSIFFWTGDCIPGSDALVWTNKMQVQNMNGGDTIATRSQPTVTQVEGLGVPRAGGYQVFAPNQNENVYTNNWQGPFYGFERVIETYEFTETPRRLKPINIYFHTYLTTKAAGMKSLDKVFNYAQSQETTPVHVADYARKVLDFQTMAVARTATGWRVRGANNLRTLRLPLSMGAPDIAKSESVAGFASHQGEVYAHLSGNSADLVLNGVATSAVRLVSANGRIEGFERLPGGYRWHLNAYVPLKFALTNAQACQVRAGGRLLTAKRRVDGLSFFEIPDHVARPLEAICRG